MKKQFSKLICLTIVLSMLIGLSGCAMMFQNVKKNDIEPEAQTQQLPELKVEESVNQTENTAPENDDIHGVEIPEGVITEAAKQPSASDEELMSDYFAGKMELLVKLSDQY